MVKQSDNKFSIIWIDMDNLKGINDNFGHEGGNDAIRGLARILSAGALPTNSTIPMTPHREAQGLPSCTT